MAGTRSGRSRSPCSRAKVRERRRWDRRAGLAPERWTLGNSRQWICSRAAGRVLEVAVGTGPNIPHYPGHISLTAVDRNRQMLSVARSGADVVGKVSLVEADAAQLRSPRRASIRWCAPSPCVSSATHAWFSPRCTGSFGPEVGCCYSITPSGAGHGGDARSHWQSSQAFMPSRHERLRFGLIERLDARKPEDDVLHR